MRKLLILVVVLIYGCSSLPEATQQSTEKPLPTNTEELLSTNTPTSTTTITPTLTLTNTPEPTNTTTQIPESLKEQIAQTYTAMVLIQTNANLLLEVADRIHSGELVGFEKVGFILGIAGIIWAIDEVIPDITTFVGMDTYWSESIEVHEITKELLGQWMDEEIDSTIVMDELEMPLEKIDEIMNTIEELLGETYGFEASELTSIRKEIIESMDEIFATPTH